MKKNSQSYSATLQEFFDTVDAEFGFLVRDYGYQRVIPPKRPFTVDFHRETLCIRVSGIHYGFGADLEVGIDGENLPLWRLMTKFTEHKTPPTDKPQLDALREYAWRLRHECSAILAGDFKEINRIREACREQEQRLEAARQLEERERFFKIAENLFRARQFEQCVKHLDQSRYELSKTWKAKFDYARKHA